VISHRYESPWLAPEPPDLVWFSGSDRVRFLNDLISQEISDMTPGAVRRAMLLDPTGKLGFLLWVLAEDDRLGLVTDPGRGEDLAGTLGRYSIRVDVSIDVEEDDRWLVIGDWEGYDLSWPTVSRRLVVGDRPNLEAGTSDDYARLRVEAGEPAWGVDLDDGAIPQVSGLVGVSVDFDKGCFLGQELVARIDSRGGQTPTRLMSVESNGPDLLTGALTIDGNEVGMVTSVAGTIGLAMVRRGTEVGSPVEAGGVPAVVKDLPAKLQT
jgi:folate-binding protein YgfZ